MSSEVSKRKRKPKENILEDAVKFFTNVIPGNERVKIKGNQDLQLSLGRIQEQATSHGLSPEHIEKLVDVAASGNFPDTVCGKLIRALIPASVVPEQAVVKVISHVCTNKPSSNLQSLFLRWILLIYDFIDSTVKLHKLYGIIFFFLESYILLPHVCHLLYLLTRKEDVKMFRIRRLLMLQAKMGNQPYLTGLLAIYKLYYPSLVTVVLSKRKRLFFPSHDRQWSAQIRKVQEQNQQVLDNSRLLQSQTEQSLLKAEPRSKKRKTDPVPIVHSDSSKESGLPREAILISLEHGKVPFVQISDLKNMLENINRIEFPSQIGAVLRSNLLQHFMSCTRDQVAATRFLYWLHATLSEEILENSPSVDDTARVEDLLEKLVHFTDFVQEGNSVLDNFLSTFLYSWNGLDFKSQILHLLTRFQLCSFQKLHDSILQPLRELFVCSSMYFKCQVVHCLTTLLQNFAGSEWPRYKDWCRVQSDQTSPTQEQSCLYMLFQEDREIFNAQTTITEFTDFICKLCMLGLQLENNHNLLLHCVLNFYEEVSNLHLRYQLPFQCLTDTSAFVVPFFCLNSVGISRLCSILCNYKEAFMSLKTKVSSGELPDTKIDGSRHISEVNMVLLDVGNALWKNQTFFAAHKSTFFNFDPRSFVPSRLATKDLFAIYMHPGIIGYTLKFLQETQPEGKLGHPKGVKPVKKLFLQFLQRENIYGVSDFIHTFMSKMSRARLEDTESAMLQSTLTQ